MVLQLLKKGIPSETIFHDLFIKKTNNEFSQIDLVLATTERIIVFEVKDYSGWIYGSGNNTNLTQARSYVRKKYKFYNPIKRLYYYSVTVFLFKKTSFKYSQRLIEILPAIIRTVQNSIEKV